MQIAYILVEIMLQECHTTDPGSWVRIFVQISGIFVEVISHDCHTHYRSWHLSKNIGACCLQIFEDTQGMFEATPALREEMTEKLQHCSHQEHSLILHCVTSPPSTSKLAFTLRLLQSACSLYWTTFMKSFKCCE